MPSFTLAIPTYNRYNNVIQQLERYLHSPYVSEVVICDDASGDCARLKAHAFSSHSKLKLYTNPNNLGASKNKIFTVGLASEKWVLLLDSDNTISDETLKILREYAIQDENRVICPSFAKPRFNYRNLKPNFTFNDWFSMNTMETAFWNTGNYLVSKSLYE